MLPRTSDSRSSPLLSRRTSATFTALWRCCMGSSFIAGALLLLLVSVVQIGVQMQPGGDARGFEPQTSDPKPASKDPGLLFVTELEAPIKDQSERSQGMTTAQAEVATKDGASEGQAASSNPNVWKGGSVELEGGGKQGRAEKHREPGIGKSGAVEEDVGRDDAGNLEEPVGEGWERVTMTQRSEGGSGGEGGGQGGGQGDGQGDGSDALTERGEDAQGAEGESNSNGSQEAAETVEVNFPSADWTEEDLLQAPIDGNVRKAQSGLYATLFKGPISGENHASSLISMPDGELICAWFNGVKEGSAGTAIFMSRLRKQEETWTKPIQISFEPERSAQNPVLHYDANADPPTLSLFHTSQEAGMGQATAKVQVLYSTDQGQSWSYPEHLMWPAGAFIRNHIIPSTQTSGRWLFPMYLTPSGTGNFSDQFSALCHGQARDWSSFSIMTHEGDRLVQPTVIRVGPSCHIPNYYGEACQLKAFFRDRNGESVYVSASENDGKKWSKPKPTLLPNNNKAIDAVALGGGRVVLVFSNSLKGMPHWLSVGLSEDDGETFPWVRDLQPSYEELRTEEGKPMEYSYPSIAVTDGGCTRVLHEPQQGIHVTYTFSRGGRRRVAIRHVCFTLKWVKEGTTKGLYRPGLRKKQAKLHYRRRSLLFKSV